MERYTIDLGGPVSIVDYGGAGPLVVCVHGLEGSAHNWAFIAPELAKSHRVIAPDLSGFGYTPPLGGGSGVERNAELVSDIIDHFGGEAMLIGNSMGGLISLLVAEQNPHSVRGLVLIDPAAPVFSWSTVDARAAARLSIPLIPWLGARLIDMFREIITVDRGVYEAMTFVSADAPSLPPKAWEHATEIAALRRTQPWATQALVEAMRSIAPYVLTKKRFRRVIQSIGASPPIDSPVLLLHGTRDRLVHLPAAHWIARERPDWTAAFLTDIGHVPMLEAPETLMQVFTLWESAYLARDADATQTSARARSAG